jgi:hypothetical protein
MSGHTLENVISNIISPFIKPPELSDLLHQRVVEIDRRRAPYARGAFLNDHSFLSHSSDPDWRVLLTHRGQQISDYLITFAPGTVPDSFSMQDKDSFGVEVLMFKQFMMTHKGNSIQQLTQLGMNQEQAVYITQSISTIDDDEHHPPILSVRVWDESRRIEGRPPVSFGVWCRMYDVCKRTVDNVKWQRKLQTPRAMLLNPRLEQLRRLRRSRRRDIQVNHLMRRLDPTDLMSDVSRHGALYAVQAEFDMIGND